MAVISEDLLAAHDQELADRLVKAGKLSRADLERATQLQNSIRERYGSLLVRLGLVSERDAATTMAVLLALKLAGSGDYPDYPLREEQLSAKFLRHHKVVSLACSDPAMHGESVVIRLLCKDNTMHDFGGLGF
jgi:general secretion pathway protein E